MVKPRNNIAAFAHDIARRLPLGWMDAMGQAVEQQTAERPGTATADVHRGMDHLEELWLAVNIQGGSLTGGRRINVHPPIGELLSILNGDAHERDAYDPGWRTRPPIPETPYHWRR